MPPAKRSLPIPLSKPSVSRCLKCVLQASLLGANAALYISMSFLLPIPNCPAQWEHRKTFITCPPQKPTAQIPLLLLFPFCTRRRYPPHPDSQPKLSTSCPYSAMQSMLHVSSACVSLRNMFVMHTRATRSGLQCHRLAIAPKAECVEMGGPHSLSPSCVTPSVSISSNLTHQPQKILHQMSGPIDSPMNSRINKMSLALSLRFRDFFPSFKPSVSDPVSGSLLCSPVRTRKASAGRMEMMLTEQPGSTQNLKHAALKNGVRRLCDFYRRPWPLSKAGTPTWNP